MRRYDAVLFDLLTALIDSWSLWHNRVGLEKPKDAPPPLVESRALEPMVLERLA